MRTRTLAVLTFAVLLVTPSVAVASVTGQPELGVQLSDNRVSPGEETSLSLTMTNEGKLTEASVTNPAFNERVTTARGLTVELGADDAPFEVLTTRQSLGSLPEGAAPSVPFRIVVDEDAEPGTYEVPVHYEYVYTRNIEETYGLTEQKERSRTEYVTVEVVAGARFEVESAETDANVGDDGLVRLSVTNVGTDAARDATLSLTSENRELTFGGATAVNSYAGTWEPNETRTFAFRADVADTADERSYTLSTTVDYEDGEGREKRSEALSFGVVPGPEQSFSVGDVDSTLRVGEEGALSGTVTNDGPGAARNVVVVFSPTAPNVNALETEYALGDLAAGDSATFEFDTEVTSSAEAGPRQFEIELRYRNAEGDQRRSDPLDVRAGVDPSRETFGVESANATLVAGQGGTVTLAVTNNGDEPLTDVSAKLYAESPISSSDDEAFVDRLAPGETKTMTFAASAAGTALEKQYPVKVDFRYDEADGDTRISDTYQVPVDVTVRESGGLPVSTPLLVGGVALLALVALAIVAYRRL